MFGRHTGHLASPIRRSILREFGKWVVGVGTEANASLRLVSLCSE
jgi:hypothetical protein